MFLRTVSAIAAYAMIVFSATSTEVCAMDNLVLNGGFDQADSNGGPTGWVYSGPAERAEAAWSTDAYEGARAVRLAARSEAEQWMSARIPLRGGVRYRLEYQTRMVGSEPWHWSTHADFVGVRVVWYDHAGDRCGVYERRTRAIGTEEWVHAWHRLEPPAETAACEIAFVRDGGVETDGVYEVDAVRLALGETAIPDGWGVVRGIIVVDARLDNYARVIAIGSDGKRYQPDENYRRLDGSFHALGEAFEVALPPGPAEIIVVKGFERTPIRRTVDVRSGAVTELAFSLPLLKSMPDAGWYAGDAHIHLFFHRHTLHPQMTPADVMAISRAEGMQWLSFKGEEKEARAFIDSPVGWDEDGFIGEIGLELVSDFHGHVYTINARSVPTVGFPMQLVPWPMNLDAAADLAQTGGAIAYAHPHDRLRPDSTLVDLANPRYLLAGREWPVDVALGQSAPFDILCTDGTGNTASKLRDYERMVSAGFRVGVCASTDAYVDQAALQPGSARTYTRAESLTWPNIADAFRRGATIATNGPLLLLTVDGAEPGDEVNCGETAEVTVEAVSAFGLTRVEVVQNGKIVREFQPDETGAVRETFALDIPESGWITARAYGPISEFAETSILPGEWVEDGVGQFAGTSAVYVLRDGRPMIPDPDAAQYFVDWIDAYETAIELRTDLFNNRRGTWGEDIRQEILDRLNRARAVFAERAGNAGRP
jgi:hypothetical protein